MVVEISQPRRKEENKSELTAESHLAPQLGSDTAELVKGKYDMRRLSKLDPLDKIWIAYFLQVPVEDGGEYAREFCENYMNLAVSDDGWRVNKMIQMVAGAQGSPTQVGELVKKPGIIGRNITNRNWKQKAEEQGQQIVE
jgi:hypothetical protein